ncbi:MAG TPA: DUF1801 domain-containing protein [Thermoanaerobaculia bacterium]|nr:DUF1801 domain-containing protein [Thermoanaerobaculia bacterium]
MVQSKAVTVDQYLAGLPEDRRETIRMVRDFVRKHIPKGYEEMVTFGMICWGIPLSRYPDTYNGQPLCYTALAAQKNYNALYLMSAYGDPEKEDGLKAAYAKAGKKLDIGKSCLRFKQLDDLVPDAVAKVIAATSPEQFIEKYEESRKLTKAGPAKKKPAAKKPARRG